MSDFRHRTADWDRLSHSSFFEIEDLPGRITVSLPSKRYRQWRTRLIVIWVGCILLTIVALPIGIGAIIAAIPASIMLGWGMKNMRSYPNEVVFTPDALHFFTLKGKNAGYLPREGMQQILVVQDKSGLRYHRFIADTGYCAAFVGSSAADAPLMNNILMAAFAQPLHLDLAAPEYESEAAVPMPMLSLSPAKP